MNERFDKSYRLLVKKDFEHLKIKSHKYSTSAFIVFFTTSRDANRSRLGIAVSKKVGNSVRRNLIKRISREYFRKSMVKDIGLDMLLVASARNLKNLNRNVLKEELKSSLHKIETGLQSRKYV